MNILQFLINIQARDNGVISRVTRLQSRVDAADRSASRLTSSLGSGLKSAILSLPGAEFFTNPIVALTTGVGVVSKLGMEAGKSEVAFNSLMGSAETGGKMLAELNKHAKDTIWGRTEIQEAAKTMAGFSYQTSTLTEDLKRMTDIAMGDKQKLGSLALVFSQVSAAGKLTGGDLLQFVNLGFNPLQFMAKKTGKSIAQLRDDMSKGLITFKDVREVLVDVTSPGGPFYQMNEKLSQTPFGKMQQLGGEFQERLLQIYKVIEPLLIPAFGFLSNLLVSLQPVIALLSGMVQWLIDNFRTLKPFIYGVAAAWAVYNSYMYVSTTILKGWTVAQFAQIKAMIMMERIQKLLNLAFVASPIGWIVLAVGALTAAVVYCWDRFAGFRAFLLTAWDTVKSFGQILKDALIDRFRQILRGLGAVRKALVSLVKGDFNEAWEHASNGAKDLIGGNQIKQIASRSRELAAQTGNRYETHLQREQEKQQAKDAAIGNPQAMAGTAAHSGTAGAGGGTSVTDGGKANEITAGGTRNTQITIHIAKFFEAMNVTMNGKTDTAELQRIVLECINRSLETAMSAAR